MIKTNSQQKILIACESSGTIRDLLLAKGYDAVSCDILDSETPGPHYKGNVLDILNDGWDAMIAHPPCTNLSSSGMHWTIRGFRDPQLTEDALEFVRILMNADIPRIAIENPVGVISTRIRPPDQYINPWQYGENSSKKTGLWLKGFQKLIPTNIISPRIVNGKKRWGNQTDSGQNKLGPSEQRASLRSKTYPGIAAAIVDQWF